MTARLYKKRRTWISAEFGFRDMLSRTALSVVLCAATAFSRSAQAQQPPASGPALEEILVTGVRPGPGLWRVSKGEHDLWILATLVPLPKDMTWRSQAAEARIASSQVVLAPPEVKADIGFFQNPRFAFDLLKARKSPDGRTLEQGLPHDIYVHWLALRDRYLGGHFDEETRPLLAASDLFQHAIDESGLTSNDQVWKLISNTAHTHHVPVLYVTINLRFDNPSAWIREFNQIPRAQEVDCFEKTIERIETDLQPMRKRANLWSVGDVNGLRAMKYPDDRITCFNAFFSVPRMHDQLSSAEAKLSDAWLAAADKALNRNASSFSVLPIGDLLKPDGWLSKLRARGYFVRNP